MRSEGIEVETGRPQVDMSTAEALAFSIREELRGIHVLLWGDQDDLVRALLILLTAAPNRPVHPLLVSSKPACLDGLKRLISARWQLEEERPQEKVREGDLADRIWFLFLAQASARSMGPWLNGWRQPLSESPGSLLIVRHADFMDLQRYAPDLLSYAGPRIYDSSTMLSICSETVRQGVRPSLPRDFEMILRELPGEPPDLRELVRWISALATSPPQ